MAIRITIVEDHPLMQKGMQMTLQAEADMEVVGLAATAEEAIDIINEQSPDVAIVDISLPGMNGIELIKALSLNREGLRVLVVSRHEEELFAERAVRAGASGYIMKINAGEQIVDAVRKIVSGGIYLSEKISSRMLMNLAGSSGVKKMSPYEMLSDRELSVFRMLGQGKPTREIARRLHISSKTVDTYKARIREKMDLADGSELLQQAVQWVRQEE